jgi:hypothetical protein
MYQQRRFVVVSGSWAAAAAAFVVLHALRRRFVCIASMPQLRGTVFGVKHDLVLYPL